MRCPCPDNATAALLAQGALERRLAAAATTTPGESRYLWQGALHHHPETVLTLTTVPDRAAALAAYLQDAHPYDVAAITWAEIAGTQATATWAREATRPDGTAEGDAAGPTGASKPRFRHSAAGTP